MFTLLMVLFLLASTASRLLTRVFTQKTQLNPYAASLLLQITTYLAGLGYALSQATQPLLEGMSIPLVIAIVAMSLIMVVFGKVSVVTQKHIDAAPFAIMRLLAVPVSALLALLVLGENITLTTFAGMIVLLVGVSIVATAGKGLLSTRLGRYELLCLANSVLLGFYTFYSYLVISQTSLATYMVLVIGVELIPSALVLLGKSKLKPTLNDIKLGVGIGITVAASIVTFWTAVAVAGNLASATLVSVFRVIVIAVASYVLLNEKSHLNQKIAGSTLAVLGMLLL